LLKWKGFSMNVAMPAHAMSGLVSANPYGGLRFLFLTSQRVFEGIYADFVIAQLRVLQLKRELAPFLEGALSVHNPNTFTHFVHATHQDGASAAKPPFHEFLVGADSNHCLSRPAIAAFIALQKLAIKHPAKAGFSDAANIILSFRHPNSPNRKVSKIL
jgi:hypothetical protein